MGSLADVAPWLVGIVVVANLTTVVLARWRRGVRDRRGLAHLEASAADAARNDPVYAPKVVRAAALRLFVDAQEAWNALDLKRLAEIAAPELLPAWERWFHEVARAGGRQRIEVMEASVHYLQFVDSDHEADKRAIVHIDADVAITALDSRGRRLQAPTDDAWATLHRRWTLARRADRWVVAAAETRGETHRGPLAARI